jgi:exosortase
MTDKWSTDPQYSHGFLVPLFAAALLWVRKPLLADRPLQPGPWGLVLVIVGLTLHLAGGYVYFDWLDMISLLPLLAGVCLCYGGRPVLRWAAPSIAFLVFMLPLPYRVEVSLSHPLQRLATVASTYVLQTLGFGAVSEGNIIIMENSRIGVVEACNGLGMLVTFFALATGVALVIKRPLLDRLLIVLSAAPIAVAANVIRITVTGILHAKVGGEIADLVFHELAGWLMMPLALGMLWFELWFLSRLLREPESERPASFFGPVKGTTAPRARSPHLV